MGNSGIREQTDVEVRKKLKSFDYLPNSDESSF